MFKSEGIHLPQHDACIEINLHLVAMVAKPGRPPTSAPFYPRHNGEDMTPSDPSDPSDPSEPLNDENVNVCQTNNCSEMEQSSMPS